MRLHPRIRKTIKYGGAALTVLLVVVWIGSGSRCFSCWNRWGLALRVSGGQIVLFYTPNENDHGSEFRFARQDFIIELQPYFPRRIANGPNVCWGFFLPLWMLAAMMLLLTALAFRLDTLARRRERMNLCQKCGYDRTGLASDTVCPECGAPSCPVAKDQ